MYTVDVSSGAATLNTTPRTALSIAKTDFNPAANRVRVFGPAASTPAANNFRLSVNPAPAAAPTGTVTPDGTLTYAAGDANAGKTPNLMGAAYTNSYENGGMVAPSTALYSVDATTNTLDLHTGGPAFSTLTTVGALGITLGGSVGFDIMTSGAAGGNNMAYLINGTMLYTVSLTTGAATQVATLSTPLKALAVTLSTQ